MHVTLKPASLLAEKISKIPGDKSLSHRALILAALAEGNSVIKGLSSGEDVRTTRRCLQTLGVAMDENEGIVAVRGTGGIFKKT